MSLWGAGEAVAISMVGGGLSLYARAAERRVCGLWIGKELNEL